MSDMKVCKCGARFAHPTRERCSFCSGLACPGRGCGRPKLPEQETCNRPMCKLSARPKVVRSPAKVVAMATRGRR